MNKLISCIFEIFFYLNTISIKNLFLKCSILEELKILSYLSHHAYIMHLFSFIIIILFRFLLVDLVISVKFPNKNISIGKLEKVPQLNSMQFPVIDAFPSLEDIDILERGEKRFVSWIGQLVIR